MAKFGEYTELTVVAVDDLIAVKDVSATATKVVEVQNLNVPIHTATSNPGETQATADSTFLSDVGRAAVAGDMMIYSQYLYIKLNVGHWGMWTAGIVYT